MKYFYILITALIFTSCNKPNRIEIEGNAPGLKNGVFGILDVLNKPVYGENIVDEKFKISEILEYPGFYQVKVTNMLDTKVKHIPYEIYLEKGNYTFEINGADLTKYPKIKTESKIQNELSAYYTLHDELLAGIKKQIEEETAFLKSDAGKNLGGLDYVNRVDKFKALEQKEKEIEASVIEKFIDKYPESTVAAHLMYNLDYKSDPARYYALYTKLSDEAKNTEEGKTLGEKLSGLSKLVKGQTAPAIYGKTPNGETFDPKSVNKKIVLIDFWRAGNEVSRTNHQLIRDKIFFQVNNKKDFGVISIDLDENADWWTKAIAEDKMTWPQYSDLKGNNSQNASAWGITRIPSYYLVDGNWKIIKRDVAFDDISFEVTEYLDKK